MTAADRLASGFDQILSRVSTAIDIAMALIVVAVLLVVTLHAVDSGRMRWNWFERTVVARARRLRPAHERYREVAAQAAANEIAAMRSMGGWLIAGAAAERAAWVAPALAPRLSRQGTQAHLRFMDEEAAAVAAELDAAGLRLALASAPDRNRWSFPAGPAGGEPPPASPPHVERPTP